MTLMAVVTDCKEIAQPGATIIAPATSSLMKGGKAVDAATVAAGPPPIARTRVGATGRVMELPATAAEALVLPIRALTGVILVV